MKQHKRIFAILTILVCIACLFAGCAEKESATTAAPTTTKLDNAGPVEYKLNTTMYCTTIKAKDLSITNQYETKLDAAVVEDPDGNHSFDLNLSLTDDVWWDFTHAGNTFTMQHEELDLPYYCAKGDIYQPGLDGYIPCDFAVDFEKEYFIYKESTDPAFYYVVASSDPDVDPMEILEHFSMYLRLYDHGTNADAKTTDFYYDISGTWFSEDGAVLGDTNLYVTGTLPAEYEDGDEVELELNFIWPKNSGYRNEGSMTYTAQVDILAEHHNFPNFHGEGTLYNSETNEQISFVYNIFPYELTVIIYMDGQYLICRLVDTTHEELQNSLNYYKDFIFTTAP